MLMTPITPKVMARPMAASSSTEPSDRPYQAFCTVDQSASLLWIAAMASAAARATSRRLLAGSPVSSASASWSPRALMMAMASSLSASVASGLNSRIAARASVKACLTPLSVSFSSAASSAGSMASSCDLNTACAASIALGGIGRQQRQAAERGIDGAAQPVVEAHGGRAVGQAGDGRAGRGIDDLAVGLGEVNLLGVGIGQQTGRPAAPDDGRGERIAGRRDRADGFVGIGEIVVGEFADRILERPRQRRQRRKRRSGRRRAASARSTVKNVGKHWTTPAGAEGRRRHRRLSGLLRRLRDQLRLSGMSSRSSGALTTALVGLGVVVAALLANPVADQVLGAFELLRPCIARDQARASSTPRRTGRRP